MNQPTIFKSGYASIIGRPNVGKSTLLNQLVAQKVAVTSNRPQTTRNKITGVVHLSGAQIILVDTPGIHATKRTLNEMMVQASLSTYKDVDLILVLIDAVEGFVRDGRIGHSHLNVPGHDGKYGFGGSCFPKDIQALIKYGDEIGVDMRVLKAAWETNLKVRPERDWEQLKGRAVTDG